MFFKEESISKFLKCPICKLNLNDAKILLCGIYCTNCVDELTKNINETTKEFECSSCSKKHIIPEDGFNSWKALEEMYSEKLNLEEIYRGESAEKLKTNLKKIQIQINELDLSSTNGEEIVKEDCLSLRNEVMLETELVIKKIQDLSEVLVNQICDFEIICISNIKPDQVKKEQFNGIINELKLFHKKWSDCLNQSRFKDSDINTANDLANDLENKFLKEKNILKELIYRNNFINFRKNKSLIDKNIIGKLEFRNFGKVDMKEFEIIQFIDIFPNFCTSYTIEDFDIFQDGKIAIAYPNINKIINLALIDKRKSICKSIDSGYKFGNSPIRLKSFKDSLIFHYLNNAGCSFLVIMNQYLEPIKSNLISHQVLSLDANETSIYCLASNDKIMIFNHELVNIRTIGQCHYPLNPFHFTNTIVKMYYRNGNFFLLYQERIDIVNETSGIITKSISVKGDRIAFDSLNKSILVLSILSSIIYEYSLDGVLTSKNEIQNPTKGLEFFIDEYNNILYLNRIERSVYFKKE